MMRTLLSLAVLTLALAACGSGDGAVTCDDGSVCPEPNMCVPGGGCEAPTEDGFCATNADGELCDPGEPGEPGEPGDGECQGGECVALICGDGEAKGNEICDGSVGADSCVAAGFDYGTPRCGDDCRADDPSRCGNIGWTDISPADPGLTNRAIYAVGNEIWLGTMETGYYHDGVSWTEDPTSNAFALHGTSRTNVWGVFPGPGDAGPVARHFDGTSWGADEPIPGGSVTKVLVVSETEIYAAGTGAIGATVWRREAGGWVVEHEDANALFFNGLTMLGDTVVAAGFLNGNIAVASRDAGTWQTQIFAGYLGFLGIWGESIDDFYLSVSGFVGGFDPFTFFNTLHVTQGNDNELLAQQAGPLVAFGDSLFSLWPGRMNQIRLNVVGTPIRTVAAPGIPPAPNGVGEPFVGAVVAGNRIVAATTAGVHSYYGTGFFALADPVNGGRIAAVSRAGSDLTVVEAASAAAARVSIISDAFGDSPSTSSFFLNNTLPRGIWASSTGGGFFFHDFSGASGIRPYAADGSLLQPFTRTDKFVRAIDGDDNGTSAMAVGDSGELWIYDGTNWLKEVVPVIGSTNLLAVREVDGAFLVAGEAGAIFVRAAGGAWQAFDSGTTSNLPAIDGTAAQFWAAGTDGVIVTCTGARCSAETVVDAPALTDISVVSAADIFVAKGSKSFHFDGLRWSEFSGDKNITTVVATEDIVWLGNSFEANFYVERLERAVSWVAAP